MPNPVNLSTGGNPVTDAPDWTNVGDDPFYDPVYGDGGAHRDGPPTWGYPDGYRHAGLDSSAAAMPEQRLNISSTIIDNTVPASYGSVRLPGREHQSS